MLLALGIAAGVMGAQPVNTWNMGGGRSWMNPPDPSNDCPVTHACWIEKYLKKQRDRAARMSPDEVLWQQFVNENARSMPVIEAAAKAGDPVAMRTVGVMLIAGVGVLHDPEAAMGWFYEAAIRGDAPSMYFLGRGFQDGVGVAPDPKLAAFWLKRAAENGVVGE